MLCDAEFLQLKIILKSGVETFTQKFSYSEKYINDFDFCIVSMIK